MDVSDLIPETMQVTVFIYDLTGRELTELTNKEYSAGTHLVKWNLDGVGSGVYIYRLSACSFAATGKLALVK